LGLRAICRSRKAICGAAFGGRLWNEHASNYNSRPAPAEVLIDKNEIHLIHTRETNRWHDGWRAACLLTLTKFAAVDIFDFLDRIDTFCWAATIFFQIIFTTPDYLLNPQEK